MCACTGASTRTGTARTQGAGFGRGRGSICTRPITVRPADGGHDSCPHVKPHLWHARHRVAQQSGSRESERGRIARVTTLTLLRFFSHVRILADESITRFQRAANALPEWEVSRALLPPTRVERRAVRCYSRQHPIGPRDGGSDAHSFCEAQVFRAEDGTRILRGRRRYSPSRCWGVVL